MTGLMLKKYVRYLEVKRKKHPFYIYETKRTNAFLSYYIRSEHNINALKDDKFISKFMSIIFSRLWFEPSCTFNISNPHCLKNIIYKYGKVSDKLIYMIPYLYNDVSKTSNILIMSITVCKF